MNRLEDGNTASLYRLDADYKIEKLENNINTSNSICWSPDGTKLYFADTWQGEIWSYDYDLKTGQISNKTIFCKIDTSDGGSADGSTVDREGYLWNAKVYSGQLVRYRPDGQIDRIIEMPVKKLPVQFLVEKILMSCLLHLCRNHHFQGSLMTTNCVVVFLPFMG